MGDTRLEPLVLSGEERSILRNWARGRSTAQGLAQRAAIVLACADGLSNTAVAARLETDRKTVRRWRTRFLAGRLDGLSDESRPGVPDHRPDLPLLRKDLRTSSLGHPGRTRGASRSATSHPFSLHMTRGGQAVSGEQRRRPARHRSAPRPASANRPVTRREP
ncbi:MULTISPECIES: helix-turn-helix domain-containing protein [Streptomyces]|uniref:helix-turn-helix domain-containing protein n=1 Tax=Streptomyces TaxID=1883 RepID=UPI003B8A9249